MLFFQYLNFEYSLKSHSIQTLTKYVQGLIKHAYNFSSSGLDMYQISPWDLNRFSKR